MSKFVEQIAQYKRDLANQIAQEIHHAADQAGYHVRLTNRNIEAACITWEIEDDPVQVELIRDAINPLGYLVIVADLYGKLSIIVS